MKSKIGILTYHFTNNYGGLLQAYSLQNLSATAAAIIFSLEGVFAAILGWIILDQYLNETKIFGIFLIVSAVIFSQIIQRIF